jgi:hypothetical protein
MVLKNCWYKLSVRLTNGAFNEVDVSGVDVIITIFCDFCQFSAKKWRFLKSKTNVMIKILEELAVVCAKNANIFAKIFLKS